MTYSVNNPPALVASGLGIGRGSSTLDGKNRQVWVYSSTDGTTDVPGIIGAANYISNGYDLGMRPGDVVHGTAFTSAGSTVVGYQCRVIAASSGGGVTLGAFMTSS